MAIIMKRNKKTELLSAKKIRNKKKYGERKINKLQARANSNINQ